LEKFTDFPLFQQGLSAARWDDPSNRPPGNLYSTASMKFYNHQRFSLAFLWRVHIVSGPTMRKFSRETFAFGDSFVTPTGQLLDKILGEEYIRDKPETMNPQHSQTTTVMLDLWTFDI